MIHVSLPDGATRTLSDNATASGLASDISKSLAKRTVAAVVNGVISDLSAPLPDGQMLS
ncbi:TGS domain-containing protein [Yoonia sp. GPGPB17]|uniref:TGS domain-containing protein n=1 Tax=Yoonia sp. GPGPB17 TaxID=3026147 RepID=UPI0040409A22